MPTVLPVTICHLRFVIYHPPSTRVPITQTIHCYSIGTFSFKRKCSTHAQLFHCFNWIDIASNLSIIFSSLHATHAASH